MPEIQPKPRRIAVVDDDSVFLELMEDLLGMGEGYEVVTSSQWVDSFLFVKQLQPDLVILDLMMGRDQTGWVILDLLRKDEATRDIPVILCSAAAPALDKYADGPPHAAVSCLAKPFDVEQLLREIQRMLDPDVSKQQQADLQPL
jgi:putative two-component system response regulator